MLKKGSVIVVVFLISGLLANAQIFNEHSFKFSKVLSWISAFYVDSVDQEKLVNDAIIKMLEDLDPHSTFISKEEVKEMSEPLEGNFEGIGISFNVLDDTIYVINPIPGGPSEKVGLEPGDRIVKIEGENVAGVGLKSTDVQKRLKGEKGTQVSISVKRRSMKNLIDFTITRDVIPINSVDAAYKIDEEFGYIKINRFSLTTMDEFHEAAKKLRSEGVESMVIDLTGNGGGYLEVAIQLVDEFLEKDRLIVYTEGLHSKKTPYQATDKGDYEDAKVIVLIDEGSASASEIFAGAIQDWDKGLIIGRRSFGKGLVQKQFRLPEGSMIRLTVARYYTPTGRLIQKPYENGNEEYQQDILNRFNHGELVNKDSIEFPDSLKYSTLKYERIVYGGGGIMPDLFIPLDTSRYSESFQQLIRRGILNRFILSYVDIHREDLLNAYPDFDRFKADFTVDSSIIQELLIYSDEKDYSNYNSNDLIDDPEMKNLIKARIAGDLWDNEQFYEIYNQTDPIYLKALDVIDHWNVYQKKILIKK